jgi:hypothetical protein
VLLEIKEVREQRVCLVDKAQLERQVFLVFKEVQAQLAVRALQASRVVRVAQVLPEQRVDKVRLEQLGLMEALALLELVLKAAQALQD